MVAAFDYCLHGRGGAAPSIDTAMHGLVDAAHVDHLHPDSGIALATAADGEALTRECFGDRVAWVPGGGPGFQLGPRHRGDPARPTRRRSARSSAATASPPGATPPTSARRTRSRSSGTAERFIAEHGRAEPFGAAHRRLRAAARRPSAARGRPRSCPLVRGLASTDRPQVGHFTDSDVVLDFLAREAHPRLAALGTSCPDHFLRTKVRPLVLDLPPTAPLEDVDRPAARAARRVPRRLRAPTTSATPTPDSPPMRGADPAIVLVPGVGMFSFGANKQTARVAGEFYVNAINVMRGAEALSTYAPIPESEKFRIEYWALEEAKLAADAEAEAARDAGRVRDRRRVGHRQGDRAAARRRGRVRRRRRHRRRQRRGRRRARSAGRTSAVERRVRRDRRGAGRGRVPRRPCSRSAASTSSSTTPACRSRSRCSRPTVGDWDLQHDVMARGSFLVVARGGPGHARPGRWAATSSTSSARTRSSPGPTTSPTARPRPTRRTRSGCSPPSSAQFGIRVNGVNPDGVVRGSGIFAKGWGADRARTYGVPGGQARRVLRPADAAQAGGPAGARRGGRVRARRRRPVADDRAAHPGRRRGGGRVPAVIAGPAPVAGGRPTRVAVLSSSSCSSTTSA